MSQRSYERRTSKIRAAGPIDLNAIDNCMDLNDSLAGLFAEDEVQWCLCLYRWAGLNQPSAGSWLLHPMKYLRRLSWADSQACHASKFNDNLQQKLALCQLNQNTKKIVFAVDRNWRRKQVWRPRYDTRVWAVGKIPQCHLKLGDINLDHCLKVQTCVQQSM